MALNVIRPYQSTVKIQVFGQSLIKDRLLQPWTGTELCFPFIKVCAHVMPYIVCKKAIILDLFYVLFIDLFRDILLGLGLNRCLNTEVI